MGPHHARAGLLVLLMFTAPFAGCMGENSGEGLPDESDLIVTPEVIPGGEWTTIVLSASRDMSVFIPYFVQDPGSSRAQNSTVLDFNKGDSISVTVLFPPRNSDVVMLLGDYGRSDWPIRAADESGLTGTWLERVGLQSASCQMKMKVVNGHGSDRVKTEVGKWLSRK